jgi:hypothetical protein
MLILIQFSIQADEYSLQTSKQQNHEWFHTLY